MNRTSLARLPGPLVPLLALALPACATTYTAAEIRSQTILSLEQTAANDLRCGSVTVADLGNGRWIARGCGRESTYKGGCDGEQCWWEVLSTSGGERGPVSAPSTAPASTPPPRAAPSPPPADEGPVPPSPMLTEVDPCADPRGYAEGSVQGDSIYYDLDAPCQMEVPETPVAMQSTVPPPAELLQEVPPPAPAPSYVWIDGYWHWTGVRYVWAPGYWATPRPGFVFVRGGWHRRGTVWVFAPGGWARVGTTVVVAPPPPRPVRVVRVHPVPRYRYHPHHRVHVAPAHRRVHVGGSVRVQGGSSGSVRTSSPRSAPAGSGTTRSQGSRSPSRSGVRAQ